MDELSADFPSSLESRIMYDPTQFVRSSIHAVVMTLLEAIALVVLVVIVFLQTWRASIIPLLAVPVSIIGPFSLLLAFGYSINALRSEEGRVGKGGVSTCRIRWSPDP